MADIVTRIREEQQLNDNRDVAQAEKDYNWNKTFSSVPPTDVLRSRLNLADTMDRAIGNRLRLAAESDVKALNILQKQREADEWQRQAPLREERLIRQVESTGAYDRFRAQKDNETQADVTGFFSEMGQGAERPGTPEYQAKLNGVLQKYPRVIGTQVGQDALKNLQKEHLSLSELTTPKEGMVMDGFDQNEDGSMKIKWKPVPTTTVPPGMVATGARTDASGNTAVTYTSPKEATASTARDLARAQSAMDRASQRRIAAQKALDNARKSKDETIINGNMDLVKAADADILEAKAELDSLQKPSTTANPVAQEAFGPPAGSAPSQIPELTDKAQFDALPSGAQYMRNGALYRKP